MKPVSIWLFVFICVGFTFAQSSTADAPQAWLNAKETAVARRSQRFITRPKLVRASFATPWKPPANGWLKPSPAGMYQDCPSCTGTLAVVEDSGSGTVAPVPPWTFDSTGYFLTASGNFEGYDPSLTLSFVPDLLSGWSTTVDAQLGIEFFYSTEIFDPTVDLAPGITFNRGGFVNETTGSDSNVVTGKLTFGPYPLKQRRCPVGAVIWDSNGMGDVGCDNNLLYGSPLATNLVTFNLSSKLISGMAYADQYQSANYPPDGPTLDGIYNMTAGFTLGPQYQGNMGTVDPNYPYFLTDSAPGTYEEYNGVWSGLGANPCYSLSDAALTSNFCSYQWNPNTHFLDIRDGTVYDNFYDTISRFGGYSSAYPLNSLLNPLSHTVGTASVQQADYDLDYGDGYLISFGIVQNQYAGGHNGNYSPTGDPNNKQGYGKTTTIAAFDQVNNWSLGQHALRLGEQFCLGLGDCLGNQTDITYASGPSSPSDIGIEPDNVAIAESPQTFIGTCEQGCTSGSTYLVVTPTTNGQQGEGRMLIDLTAGTMNAGTIIAMTTATQATKYTTGHPSISGMPGTLTAQSAGTFTPSIAFGATTSQVLVTAEGQGEPGDQAVPVYQGGGTGIFSPGIVCIVDSQSAEQVNVTSFTASPTITGSTTHGSETVTSLSSLTGVVPGALITGGGIPANTTIMSVDTVHSQLTLSANATADSSGETLTVYSGTMEATFRYPHMTGATIAQGGTCGYGLEITADTKTFDNPGGTIRTLIPLYGSPSDTVTYGDTNIGTSAATYAQRNVSAAGVNFTPINGGTAIVVCDVHPNACGNFGFEGAGTLFGNGNQAFGNISGLEVTIQGCEDRNLNGSFPVQTQSANTFYFVPNAPDSSPSCTNSGATITFANGAFNLFPRAQVLSVYDSNPSPTGSKQIYNSVDGTFTVEPNSVSWNTGDQIEEPHWHSPAITDVQNFVQPIIKPTAVSRGKYYTVSVSGDKFIGDFVNNDEPVRGNYAGFGGTLTPPLTARSTGGYWQDAEEFGTAPTTALLNVIHCKPDNKLTSDEAGLFRMYSAGTTYYVGDTVYTGSPGSFVAYVAMTTTQGVAPDVEPPALNTIWQPYNGCTSSYNAFNLMQLPDGYGHIGGTQIIYSPLTASITYDFGLPCQSIFSGRYGLRFTYTSGDNCGVSTPYIASVGPNASYHFTASGCGAIGALGGPSGGRLTVSSTSSCLLIITMGEGATAPNAWSCWMNNLTFPTSVMQQTLLPTGDDPTKLAAFTGTPGNSSLLNLGCMAY